MKGMGIAANQPHSNTLRRPTRSESRPATKFMAPLTKPKLMMKAINRVKEPDAMPNSDSASAGTTLRCRPMVRPTKKTCRNCWLNWPRFSRMPCT